MNVHQLIDRFVSLVNERAQVFSPGAAPWIDVFESNLPSRLPASFRSLVSRYTFPAFTAGGLAFFQNLGADSPDELSIAVFKDRFLAECTLKSGYIQFARPAGGSYDPVCFDARRAVKNREFPILRLDHEAILCRGQNRVVSSLADSFYRLVADFANRA